MKPAHGFLFVAGLMLMTTGCGSKSTITGTVTFHGAPMPAGTILFVPDNGAPPVTAPIKDGKYTAERVPAGTVKISIASNHNDKPATLMMANMMSKMGPPPNVPIPTKARQALERSLQFKKGFRISPRYADPALSGLTCTIESGSQTKDFQLD